MNLSTHIYVHGFTEANLSVAFLPPNYLLLVARKGVFTFHLEKKKFEQVVVTEQIFDLQPFPKCPIFCTRKMCLVVLPAEQECWRVFSLESVQGLVAHKQYQYVAEQAPVGCFVTSDASLHVVSAQGEVFCLLENGQQQCVAQWPVLQTRIVASLFCSKREKLYLVQDATVGKACTSVTYGHYNEKQHNVISFPLQIRAACLASTNSMCLADESSIYTYNWETKTLVQYKMRQWASISCQGLAVNSRTRDLYLFRARFNEIEKLILPKDETEGNQLFFAVPKALVDVQVLVKN